MKATNKFKMAGCPELIVSGENNWQCGGETGFAVNYEGRAGGILPNTEARKLAEYLLKILDEEENAPEA